MLSSKQDRFMSKPSTSSDLLGSRVYLADFDRVTYSQVAWTEEDVELLILHLERKLKTLLLVKGHVIIPASHLLDSDLAREILGPYPELFKSGAVVPLLQGDRSSARSFREKMLGAKKDVAEFFQGEQVAEMAALLDENARFVRFNARCSSRWFRDRILADLSDPKSLIRLIYKERKLKFTRKTIQKIADKKKLDRHDLYWIAKGTNNLQQWELLSNYADFVYYLGEALAVGSEGILPQENIMDFTTSALAGKRTRLSESQILTKVFVDTIKAVTSTHFPTDFLDALRIPDAVELHQIAVQSDFIAKYNAIQRAVKDGLVLQDAERLVLTFEELGEMEHQLQTQFEAALKRELPRKMVERRLGGLAKALHTIGTLAIPFYGNLDAAVDLILSAFNVAGKDQIANDITRRVQNGVGVFQRVVDRRKLSDRPVLLDFVERMKQRYVEYL
jgi:hypothetical protein